MKDPAPLKVEEFRVAGKRYVICLNEEEKRKDGRSKPDFRARASSSVIPSAAMPFQQFCHLLSGKRFRHGPDALLQSVGYHHPQF